MPNRILPNKMPSMTILWDKLASCLLSQVRFHSVMMVDWKTLVSNSVSEHSSLQGSVTFSVLQDNGVGAARNMWPRVCHPVPNLHSRTMKKKNNW